MNSPARYSRPLSDLTNSRESRVASSASLSGEGKKWRTEADN